MSHQYYYGQGGRNLASSDNALYRHHAAVPYNAVRYHLPQPSQPHNEAPRDKFQSLLTTLDTNLKTVSRPKELQAIVLRLVQELLNSWDVTSQFNRIALFRGLQALQGKIPHALDPKIIVPLAKRTARQDSLKYFDDHDRASIEGLCRKVIQSAELALQKGRHVNYQTTLNAAQQKLQLDRWMSDYKTRGEEEAKKWVVDAFTKGGMAKEKVKLTDPISLCRPTYPARAVACLHFQTFDLQYHFTRSMKGGKDAFHCPVCGGKALADDCYVDNFFRKILAIEKDAREVILFPEGNWESAEKKKVESVLSKSCVVLISDDESEEPETSAPAKTPSTSSTQKTNNVCEIHYRFESGSCLRDVSKSPGQQGEEYKSHRLALSSESVAEDVIKRCLLKHGVLYGDLQGDMYVWDYKKLRWVKVILDATFGLQPQTNGYNIYIQFCKKSPQKNAQKNVQKSTQKSPQKSAPMRMDVTHSMTSNQHNELHASLLERIRPPRRDSNGTVSRASHRSRLEHSRMALQHRSHVSGPESQSSRYPPSQSSQSSRQSVAPTLASQIAAAQAKRLQLSAMYQQSPYNGSTPKRSTEAFDCTSSLRPDYQYPGGIYFSQIPMAQYSHHPGYQLYSKEQQLKRKSQVSSASSTSNMQQQTPNKNDTNIQPKSSKKLKRKRRRYTEDFDEDDSSDEDVVIPNLRDYTTPIDRPSSRTRNRLKRKEQAHVPSGCLSGSKKLKKLAKKSVKPTTKDMAKETTKEPMSDKKQRKIRAIPDSSSESSGSDSTTEEECNKGSDMEASDENKSSSDEDTSTEDKKADVSSQVSSGESDKNSDLNSDEEDVYHVEGVRGRRVRNGAVQYLIKWEGYADSQNTWEPEESCSCNVLIAEYLKLHPPKKLK